MKLPETTTERIERKLDRKLRLIRVARGEEPADVVFKNATYLNVFSNDFCHGDIAVSNGLVADIGSYHGIEEIDVSGRFVSPGFIDAHIHLESSMVSPAEFARAVVSHGTTTVITDPHEIANVMGVEGIRYMLEATESLPIDVHFMLPSCVPATPLDESGCALDYKAIDDLYDHPRVLGLAEMMNYVGVVHGDREVAPLFAETVSAMGFNAHAPQYTEEYDLITCTQLAKGFLPERKKNVFDGQSSRAGVVYQKLLQAMDALQALVRRSKGRDNKTLGAMAEAIRKITEKFEF